MSETESRSFCVAVVGATGAVGREMLATLQQFNLPVREIRALASARSAGSALPFAGSPITVQELTEESFAGVDIALFSAGGSVSREFGPIAAKAGAIVIDNSSAFRMDRDVPLVVPEVNPNAALDAFTDRGGRGIIANPNCSTIQMVVALQPLHQAALLTRVIVSTYQSVSGAGQQGITELLEGTRALLQNQPDPTPNKFAHPIAFNALPHIDVFFDSGYTREEMKMTLETRKIMGLPELPISATCVRVPVLRGHSEAVTVETERPLTVEQARALLGEAPGIQLLDDPSINSYPTPRAADGNDVTWVGRVRQDLDLPNTLHMWVVSDNLRKGAATNAVQIAQLLIERDLIGGQPE